MHLNVRSHILDDGHKVGCMNTKKNIAHGRKKSNDYNNMLISINLQKNGHYADCNQTLVAVITIAKHLL